LEFLKCSGDVGDFMVKTFDSYWVCVGDLGLEDIVGAPLEEPVSGRKQHLIPIHNSIIDSERYNERDQESSPLFSRYNIVTT